MGSRCNSACCGGRGDRESHLSSRPERTDSRDGRVNGGDAKCVIARTRGSFATDIPLSYDVVRRYPAHGNQNCHVCRIKADRRSSASLLSLTNSITNVSPPNRSHNLVEKRSANTAARSSLHVSYDERSWTCRLTVKSS